MKSSLLAAAVILSITMTASAVEKEGCCSCHGREGAPGYVDKSSFEQSVHGAMNCTSCHAGYSGYPHRKTGPVRCGKCHFTGPDTAAREEIRKFKMSVHGQAVAAGTAAAPDCRTCHGSHAIYRSSDERSGVYRQKIPSLCSQCHPRQFEEYAGGIHGRQFLEYKNQAAPTCFDCHMEHRNPKTGNKQWKLALILECGECHAGELNTYHRTYHGKVTRLGYATIAKCSDCHGSHGILPPSDPRSSLSGQNIVITCAKCHPGATASFTRYYAHAEEGNRKKYPVLYYTYLFMTLLLVSVFAFFLTHTLLWTYRALRERAKRNGGE